MQIKIHLRRGKPQMAHRSKDKAIFSFRTLVGFALITVGIIVMVFVCMITLSVPCVSNFYNQLPVYPEAELISERSSTLNWIGIGDLEFDYRTGDDVPTVEAWYKTMVDDAIEAATYAQVSGEPIPEAWRHLYLISASDAGTDIRLISNCLR
jgi:hypothetical protein